MSSNPREPLEQDVAKGGGLPTPRTLADPSLASLSLRGLGIVSNYAVPPIAWALIGIATIFVAWDLLARLIGQPDLFPWPRYLAHRSLSRFADLPDSTTVASGIRRLGISSSITLCRVAISTTIGILGGIAVGMLSFLALRPLRVADIIFRVLRGVPLLSLIPLFVYWFGANEAASVYGYISYAVFVIIASDAYGTACALPQELIAMARLTGRHRIDTLLRLILPPVLHDLGRSVQAVIGLAWAFSVGAEFIVLNDGLGYLLHIAYLQTDVGRIMLLAVTYACLSWGSVTLTSAVVRAVQTKRRTVI
jgi:ABC-type nitrate/sulfonate/bicarbonate transport system permease component